MFELNEKNQSDRKILKCGFNRYSLSESSTINTTNYQIFINWPREDNVISLLNSYFELIFDVLHAATGNRYVDGNDIGLVILGPIALFGNYKLADSSGKHLEELRLAHSFWLMYIL